MLAMLSKDWELSASFLEYFGGGDTHGKINMSHEMGPFQKENSVWTINFQGLC